MNQERKAGEPSALIWLWLTVFVIAFDLITKQLAENFLTYGQPVPIFPVFDLTLLYNPGAAFSFLAGEDGWQRWFFTAIAAIASVVFLVWLAKTPKSQTLISIAFALMLSGAAGNLIDRALFGYVIDFLDFHWSGNHFPVFNVADSMIFIGAAFMILDSFTAEGNAEKSKKIEDK
jgi:signal peptidase II